jgi:RecA/RadA recombinase
MVAPGKDGKEQAKRQQALDFALGQIEKQYGKGSIMRLGEQKVLDGWRASPRAR